jgi:SAM-dependent methyltransferase
MLARAREKLALAAAPVQTRLRLVYGDMTNFDLGQQFQLVVIPFRAFQALLTPEAERSCLEAIRRHLAPGGRLVIDVFDPRLDLLLPGRIVRSEPLDRREVRHPRTGNIVRIDVLDRFTDTLNQVLEETWRFSEIDPTGATIREETESLRLRWLYRQEMRYLLELCGFEVEAEYSDFFRSPPAYGKEQVWVAHVPQ